MRNPALSTSELEIMTTAWTPTRRKHCFPDGEHELHHRPLPLCVIPANITVNPAETVTPNSTENQPPSDWYSSGDSTAGGENNEQSMWDSV